jgi:adenine-specific DNA-methyltransferase
MEQKITNNIASYNKDLHILKLQFPHCFNKNGQFDFEKFRNELESKEIEISKESYGMDWLGKSYARLLASDPATTLLKEDTDWNTKIENKNSQNLLLKGDNLEVLKHLSNAYHESVKMIYIDPPYNTGSDGFVYTDDRKFSVQEFQKLAGVDEEKAKKILSFVKSESNSHSAWLTFMYPRLYIAKQLLKDDGVIFISIDDNELAQLRILMDEIFGEENFVAVLARKTKTTSNSGNQFAPSHEYIIVWAKNINELNIFNDPEAQESEDYIKLFKKEDDYGKYNTIGLYQPSLKHGGSRYYITCPDGTKVITPNNLPWRWNEQTFLTKKSENRVVFIETKTSPLIDENGNQAKWNIYTKLYLQERLESGMRPISFIDKYTNSEGSKELLKMEVPFTFSKPRRLMQYLMKICGTKREDIILDFFAGSGTTGDAVMQLNSEDGENRKYILVQLPELVDPKKNKMAFDFVKNELRVEDPTIFEITKERLIRAAKKILKENIDRPAKSEKVNCEGFEDQHCASCKGEHTIKIEEKKAVNLNGKDFGFKIFGTVPIWEDYEFVAEEFDPTQQLFDESKLTVEDLQTLLTTWKTYDGIPLSKNLETIDLDGYNGYYGNKKLYLMNKGFQTKNLKILLEKIDTDSSFEPASIIVFGYNFESKNLREIAENILSYSNKKQIDIDFVTRY